MLNKDTTVLVIIDVQERLANVMSQKENLIANLKKLIKGMKVFQIPIIVTEQFPKGLGPTVSEISELLTDIKPLPKLSFDCCDDEAFMRELKSLKRKQILVSGIESHICVYQTVSSLVNLGYEVHVITDTISSRTVENRNISFNLMNSIGATLTSTETVLFEILRKAEGEQFRIISSIVK